MSGPSTAPPLSAPARDGAQPTAASSPEIRLPAEQALQRTDVRKQPGEPDGREKQAQLNRIRQHYASAQAKARYAVELHGTTPRDVHERLERYAKEAIELYYELGQLIADPALAGDSAQPRGTIPPPSGSRTRVVLPGEEGFDPWCLTDPDARTRLTGDREARKAVRQMRQLDPGTRPAPSPSTPKSRRRSRGTTWDTP